MKRKPLPTLEDIFARCIVLPYCGCWVWEGPDNGKGPTLSHGKMRFAGLVRYVHRVVWFLVNGYWPTQHIHHKCEVRMCCNPDHLADVLPIVNYELGRGPDCQFKTDAEYNGVDPSELA